MSNSRIFTTDGKSASGTKYFGMTVKDRQSSTTPNMTQTTIIPASDTIQQHNFILGAADTNGMSATNTLTVTPDLTLLSTRYYQFTAYLTLTVKHSSTYYTGHYLLSSAAKGAAIIGSTSGYRLDTISSETGIDTYMPETAITIAISGSKFVITATAEATIDSSLDLLADISINSALFTP